MLTPPKAESIDVSPRTFHRGDGSFKRHESRRELAQRRSNVAKAEYARIKAIEERQKRTFDAYAFVMGFGERAA